MVKIRRSLRTTGATALGQEHSAKVLEDPGSFTETRPVGQALFAPPAAPERASKGSEATVSPSGLKTLCESLEDESSGRIAKATLEAAQLEARIKRLEIDAEKARAKAVMARAEALAAGRAVRGAQQPRQEAPASAVPTLRPGSFPPIPTEAALAGSVQQDAQRVSVPEADQVLAAGRAVRCAPQPRGGEPASAGPSLQRYPRDQERDQETAERGAVQPGADPAFISYLYLKT